MNDLKEKNSKVNPLGYVLNAIMISLQFVAVWQQLQILQTITSNVQLASTTAVILGLAPAAFFGIALALSPVDAQVTKMLAWTPGGVVALLGGVMLMATLFLETPILVSNKYTSQVALLVIFGTQLPAALLCSMFSIRLLKDLCSESRYAFWMYTTRRMIKLILQVEMFVEVQRAIYHFADMIDSSPNHKKELVKFMDGPRNHMLTMSHMVEELADTQEGFATDPMQQNLYGQFRQAWQTRLPVYERARQQQASKNEGRFDAFRESNNDEWISTIEDTR